MKIYDCFSFYNEFDILDLHLAELYDHVDYFVLAEANTTHQSKPKEFLFEKNQDRYAKYLDKIIHVKVEDMPQHPDTWVNERFQRDAIMRGLVDAHPDDICIIGDVDEIPRVEVVQSMRAEPRDIMGLRIPYFNFKYNYMLINNTETYYVWTVACRRKLLDNPSEFRQQRFSLHGLGYNYDDNNVRMYEHAGWHFTYMGNDDFIRNKIKNFAHAELNRDDVLDRISVEESIRRGIGFNPDDPRQFVPVLLDDYFPKTILANPDHYRDTTLSSAQNSARQYLPQ